MLSLIHFEISIVLNENIQNKKNNYPRLNDYPQIFIQILSISWIKCSVLAIYSLDIYRNQW